MSRRTTRGRLRHAALIVLAASGLVATTTLPAHARPLVQERYSFTDTFEDCDGAISVDIAVQGTFTIKDANPSTDGQFFPASDKFRSRAVVTNVDTGRWVIAEHNALFKEVQPRHLGDGVFEFRAQEAGQPFVISDASGRVVYRDRGLIVHSLVFDTLSDGTPGGMFLAFETIRVAGPHPILERGLCAVFIELTG